MTHTLDTPRGMRGVVPDARTTRLGAGLGITGLVLTAAGIALAAPTAATLSSSPSDIVGFYTEGGMARTVAGGFVELLGIVSFLPFAVMLTSRVRAAGGRAELLAATARTAATVYVAVSLAPGMSAGATALWLGHHGTTDATILVALTDLRSLSYFVALVPYAVFLGAVGAAGLAGRGLPRWGGWSAVVIGIALVASVPFAGYGMTDVLALVSLLWIAPVAVALLRTPEPSV